MSRAEVIELATNVHVAPAASFTGAEADEFAIGTLEKNVIIYHIDHAVKLVSIIAIK